MSEFATKYPYVSELPTYSGVEVAWGTWEESSDKSLHTMGIDNCIGLAIFDRTQRVGYMAHILFMIRDGKYDDRSRFGNQDDVLNPMLATVASNLRSPEDLEIWLTGGTYDSDSGQMVLGAEMRRQRVLVKLAFLDVPESNYHLSWNEEEVGRVDMTLDVVSGICNAYFVRRGPF